SPTIGALTPHRTTPFELPEEVCLILTDELASPADFYLYSTVSQRLKSGRRVLVVSAADDLARWKAVAGKSGVNLAQHSASKAFEYYDVSAELDRILESVDQDGVPPLRALYDAIVDRLALQEAPSLIILDALSELLWLGLPEKDARLFVRALRALCLKNHTGLIIRLHKTADGEHDELLAFLTQLCHFRLDVCPLASGRSGLVSGEIVLRRGASCFVQHMHVKTIPRSSALQYRLSDYSAMYFEKGTDRAVL
ncbi:hypothetical protein EV122DRAFT_222053, partial [Schizophyllum commune]